jgi:Holliday junction resolvase RusA-like endonuclease
MLYSLEHSHTVRQFVPAPAYRLRLSFYITLGKLLTKEQKIKRLDISNRIKPIEDALCAMLSIDDKDFVEVTALKLLSPRDHSWVDASIISLDISPEELFKT